MQEIYNRLPLTGDLLERLGLAGAFDSLGLDRRAALFELETSRRARPAGRAGLLGPETSTPSFPTLSPDELLHLDLATTGLSPTGRHPLDAHRSRLRDLGCMALGSLKHGQSVWTAGLVVVRQLPRAAVGFAFYVIEDGMHWVQAIISPDLWEAHRQLLRDASVLIVQGVAAVNGRSVTLRVERLCGMLGQ